MLIYYFVKHPSLLYVFQTKTLVHVNNTIPETDGTLFYKSKLKPITTCLKIIQACLVGKKKRIFIYLFNIHRAVQKFCASL